MRRLAIAALSFVALGACGGNAPATSAPTSPGGQDLAHAASLLCATPVRAEADLEYHTDDPSAKAVVLDRHLKDNITNARVLAMIAGWKGKSAEQKVTDLDQLTHDALLSSKCRLRDLWASPGAVESADPG